MEIKNRFQKKDPSFTLVKKATHKECHYQRWDLHNLPTGSPSIENASLAGTPSAHILQYLLKKEWTFNFVITASHLIFLILSVNILSSYLNRQIKMFFFPSIMKDYIFPLFIKQTKNINSDKNIMMGKRNDSSLGVSEILTSHMVLNNTFFKKKNCFASINRKEDNCQVQKFKKAKYNEMKTSQKKSPQRKKNKRKKNNV